MRPLCVVPIVPAVILASLLPLDASADVTVFFNPGQVATTVENGTTWDVISSEGYLFTYTMDKLFTGGGPTPIGRPVAISWPDGVEAQFITTPVAGKASITIQRVDGGLFDLTSFTAHLLANAGAGRAIEIVPMLNGQEPFQDPFYFDVSGVYGQKFSYDTSPNPNGSTAPLVNFDTYVVTLTLDYALTALTLTDPTATSVDAGSRTPPAGDLRVSPNPASSTAQIELNGDRKNAEGQIAVYSVSGARVRVLALDDSGHTTWDLRDDGGRRVAAGMYFVRVESGAGRAALQRVMVVK